MFTIKIGDTYAAWKLKGRVATKNIDSRMTGNLREKLSEITGGDGQTGSPISEHIKLIEALKTEDNHKITKVDNPWNRPLKNYTCAMDAFYLVDDSLYESIATYPKFSSTFAGSEFVHFLLDKKKLQEVHLADIQEGDFIIYFHNDKFTHIGRVISNNRLQSKWGTGEIYQHDVWEVPISYGDKVRYFRGLDETSSRELFYDYARNEGFTLNSEDD